MNPDSYVNLDLQTKFTYEYGFVRKFQLHADFFYM